MSFETPAAGVQSDPIFYLATVRVTLNGGTLARLEFDGAGYTTEKYYKVLRSYTAALGDRVLVVKMSGTFIVLGKIS